MLKIKHQKSESWRVLYFLKRQMRRVLFYSKGLGFARGKMRGKCGMTQQATNFYFSSDFCTSYSLWKSSGKLICAQFFAKKIIRFPTGVEGSLCLFPRVDLCSLTPLFVPLLTTSGLRWCSTTMAVVLAERVPPRTAVWVGVSESSDMLCRPWSKFSTGTSGRFSRKFSSCTSNMPYTFNVF